MTKKLGNLNLGYDNPTIKAANVPSDPGKPKADAKPASRRGRPQKNPDELRSERLSVALTRKEVSDIQTISAATGVGSSELIRMAILKLIEGQDMGAMRRAAEEREGSKIGLE